jgi:hypothetical protein
MAKKNIVKLTESKLQEMIIEAVKQSLNENVFTDMGNAIGNTWNNVRQKFDDEMDNMERGYDIQNGRPQSFDEVIKGNGWKIHARKPSEDNSEMYYIISTIVSTHALQVLKFRKRGDKIARFKTNAEKNADFKGGR